ncbi:MAG TPA: hypothetical protein PKI32_03575 [Opitutales bacterium]|nr:hypothetical protein [Opitutales bacterium]
MAARRNRKKHTRLWLPPLASLALAAFIQHGNQMLAGQGLSLWMHCDALFLVFPLLYLRYAHGMPQVAFTALAIGAFSPLPYGTHLFIYASMLVVMIPYRVRIRRENPAHVFWLAAIMEAACFSAEWLVATLMHGHPAVSPLSRILTDLILSSVVCGAAAFWWMELQRRVIVMISGEDPAGYPILY